MCMVMFPLVLLVLVLVLVLVLLLVSQRARDELPKESPPQSYHSWRQRGWKNLIDESVCQ